MKNLILVTFFFFFVSNTIIAQSKMQPAIIIDSLGNTKAGFIKYSSTASLCQKILFSSTLKAPPQVYKPHSIKAFELTELNRKFIQAIVAKDTVKNDTVFLENIIQIEDKKLYCHQSKSGAKRFFLETQVIGFKELIEKVSTVKLNGTTYTTKKKEFVGLLKLAFKECDAIDDAYFKNVSLNIVPLAKVFERYSECISKETTYKSAYNLKPGDLNLIFGVGFSYALTSSNLPKNLGSQNYLQDPEGVLGIPISFGLNYYPPRLRNTFFMGFGCSYQHKGAIANLNNTKFDLHYLNVYMNFGYQYPFGKVKPFIGADFSSGFLMNPNSAFTRTHPYSGDLQYLFYNYGDYDGGGTEFGLGAFLGVDIPIFKHGLRLELKYIYGRWPFLSSAYGTNYIQFQVQFRFKT
ncbi:hypothetical protein [Aureispira sp. CCB-E]|uniref:hypothetical protein n=1 Tax=Aureispira sp. CCB-E TaxID=3051121 RepID=UPI002868F363|nr:hypothetical protein [Aureispira sp. CCB-E]WMX16391.1 hypothetical protein QP953_08430 [Aureispira sp. CCB-E]